MINYSIQSVNWNLKYCSGLWKRHDTSGVAESTGTGVGFALGVFVADDATVSGGTHTAQATSVDGSALTRACV